MSKHTIYLFQELALAPFVRNASRPAVIKRLSRLDTETRQGFLLFLIANGFSYLWTDTFDRDTFGTIWPTADIDRLFSERNRHSPAYRRQFATLVQASRMLDQAAVAHAFFKGVHTREAVYTSPLARKAVDLDLLIEEKNRAAVSKRFRDLGFACQTRAENLTHELSLIKDNIYIDLHWHILRPGRVSRELTAKLLAKRSKADGYWSLADDDQLFALLVHPVFSEYSMTTRTGLIRLLDVLFWLQKKTVDWDYLTAALATTGLRSAAWITLEYLRIITGVTIPDHPLQKLQPSGIKARYLHAWIESNLPARLEKWRFVVKCCFTLAAHDSLTHTGTFLRTFLSDKIRRR